MKTNIVYLGMVVFNILSMIVIGVLRNDLLTAIALLAFFAGGIMLGDILGYVDTR